MIDLRHAVQEKGYTVAHIKTDSIKIPGGDFSIINFVMEFGEKYGYTFEHEVTYDKFCLVNNAVYVAKKGEDWTAVGAQFQHPYVYKKMFSHEPIIFEDFVETKAVKIGTMYLDMNDSENVADMLFIGSIGQFVPVEDGGGTLWRIKDDKKYAVTGTKGYKWMRRDAAAFLDAKDELHIDTSYFKDLWMKGLKAINDVGSYDELIGDIHG